MTISLTGAMRDPCLLGAPFQAPSFWTWLTVAKLIDGLPLEEREAELFRQSTGRTELPAGPVRRLYLLIGRRGGKDRFASAVAVWTAALAADWRTVLSQGEQGVVLLIGADLKQAKIMRRYAVGLCQAPLIAAEVVSETREGIEFRNGTSVEIVVNDARLVRGRSALAVLGSESCHWRTDEDAMSSDIEVVAAAEPSLAMTPNGLLMLASSTHRKRGVMYTKWRDLWGNNEAQAICWLASTETMNPALNPQVVADAMRDDPDRACAEYLSRWREDLSDLVPADAVEACTLWGTREIPPADGIKYFGFVDPSGGTGSDAMSLGIGHRAKDGTAVLDLLRARQPRFIPQEVAREFAETLRAYRIREVQGDRYSAGWCANEFQGQGIRYRPSDKTKSDLYLAGLPLLLGGRCRLLDDQTMRRQFAHLERRTHAHGRESVDHAQGRHDDLANAAIGALLLAAAPEARCRVGAYGYGGGRIHWRDQERPRTPIRIVTIPEADAPAATGYKGWTQ